MIALTVKEKRVQAFKVGPDFLYAMTHLADTGRVAINLDGWILDQ